MGISGSEVEVLGWCTGMLSSFWIVTERMKENSDQVYWKEVGT